LCLVVKVPRAHVQKVKMFNMFTCSKS
jgi:hypothetical protein